LIYLVGAGCGFDSINTRGFVEEWLDTPWSEAKDFTGV
jgi:hypothetical protein